ncbi:Rhodanese-like domain-containing protein [Hysterangium stoloniferum]|nr:Rhodanese-like domain-containing protein [Hysterangium stoloniferum]
MLRSALRQSLSVSRRSTLPIVSAPSLHIHRINAIRFASSGPAETVQPVIKRSNVQIDWVAPKVPYEEVKRRTRVPTEDAYLIDVREADEVAQGTIPSAVSIPLSVLSTSLHIKGDEFHNQFGFLKPAYNQEIIFYCRSGKRSASACDIATKHGYTNVKNYEGSWLDWVQREQIKTSS